VGPSGTVWATTDGVGPDMGVRYFSWCASALVGRVKQNLAPRGRLSAAHKRPPCDSTMERLIRRPIPVPWVLVVKNALKILSACCGGSLTPVSLTDICTS